MQDKIVINLCENIRKADKDRRLFNDEQIIFIDLMNMFLAIIADRHLIKKQEKAIRGMLCVALSVFFGHRCEEWLPVVDEKIRAAILERVKGSNTFENIISIEEITMQFYI